MTSSRLRSKTLSTNTEQPTVNKPVELKDFWKVLVLRYVDTNTAVWYDYETSDSYKTLPEGKLEFVDIQTRDFDGALDYKLLVGLSNTKQSLILCMGLKTISALSLIEPLCLLPDKFLDAHLVFHHEFQKSQNNVFIKFKVQCGMSTLNAPLSSGQAWKQLCFRRVTQLQRKLSSYTPIEFEALNDFEPEF